MDAASIKAILETPAALLVLMFAASLASGIKQIVTAKQAGQSVSLGEYLKYWPETIATVLGNVIAFTVLIYTDQLNFASALGIGYGVNSAVDLMRVGGRSSAVSG